MAKRTKQYFKDKFAPGYVVTDADMDDLVDSYQDPDVLSTLTYASTTNIDFDADNVRTLTLTGNVTFTTSNKGAGKSKIIRILAGASLRTLTFPAGWVFLGDAAPVNIASGKTAILSLYCFGTAEADVVAAYNVQP